MELLKQANGNIVRTKEEKDLMIELAAQHYGNFLTALGFDFKADENSSDTPRRVAKSFVEDLISGSFDPEPRITSFPNTNQYPGIVCQTNITISSLCSHHHREIYGKCHIAYIPGKDGQVIGLSKLNRISNFYSQRFQLQEELTMQINRHVDRVCEKNLGVAVLIEAEHGCVKCRGVRDQSKMITAELTGVFIDSNDKSRDEFYRMIELSKK